MLEVGVNVLEVQSRRFYELASIDIVLVVALGAGEVSPELKDIGDFVFGEEGRAVGEFEGLRVQGIELSCDCFFNEFVVEDSHILIDGISDEMAVSSLIVGVFFLISLSIDVVGFEGGETLFSYLMLIIFVFCVFLVGCLFFFFMLLIFLMCDSECLIGESIASDSFSFYHFISIFDVMNFSQEVVLIDEFDFFGYFEFSALDFYFLALPVFGENSSVELDLGQLVEGFCCGRGVLLFY